MKPKIVITRPAHQANELAQGIQTAGGDSLLFPTLAIAAEPATDESRSLIQNISQFDIIIFISKNAVEHGLNQIQTFSHLPDSILLATIGQGSATSLFNKLGREADIVPSEDFNSEGLLATTAMQNVKGKRILIVKGIGGREHLQNTLRQRGAIVDCLNAYQRFKPELSSTEIEQHLQNNTIAAIVVTSAASLKNLYELVPEKVRSQLLQASLLLINKRLIDAAKALGFCGNFVVSSAASDAAIINTLQQNKLLP